MKVLQVKKGTVLLRFVQDSEGWIVNWHSNQDDRDNLRALIEGFEEPVSLILKLQGAGFTVAPAMVMEES